MLELKNISFSYEGRGTILNEVSFHLKKKEFVIIKGSSGSGKSTLLRLMNRLNEPHSGEIFFKEKPVVKIDVTSLRKKICYIQQVPVMIEGSIKDNILIPYSFKSLSSESVPASEAIRALLDRFLLKHLKLTDNALSLSIGEQQRIALIRALLLNPEVMLLDEPTSALDEMAKHIVEENVGRLFLEKSVSIVMVTHSEMRPGDVSPNRVLVLKNEKLIEELM